MPTPTPLGGITTQGPVPAPPDPFAAGRVLLPGMEVGHPGEPWRAGDAVLFAIAAETPKARSTRYLRATLLGYDDPADASTKQPGSAPAPAEPASGSKAPSFLNAASLEILSVGDVDIAILSSRMISVQVEIFDEAGALLSSSVTRPSEYITSVGLYDYSMLQVSRAFADAAGETDGHDRSPEETAAMINQSQEIKRGVVGLSSMISMNRSLQRRGSVFRSTLLDLIERPSFLSMLTGMRLVIEQREEERVAPIQAALGPLEMEGYVIPMRLTINENPAMLFDMHSVPVAPPLGLAAGLVKLEARHPSKPGRRVVVSLIGARRGPEGAESGGGQSAPSTWAVIAPWPGVLLEDRPAP